MSIPRNCPRKPPILSANAAASRSPSRWWAPTCAVSLIVWNHVLQKLRNADLDRIRQSFPEYPHPDLLRAIDVSMESIPADFRQRYLDFAVFPEDSSIPDAAIGTLWNLDDYEV